MSQERDLANLRNSLSDIAKIWYSPGFDSIFWEETIKLPRDYNSGTYHCDPAIKEKRASSKQKKKMLRIVGDHFSAMSDEELLSTKGCSFELQPHSKADQMVCLIKYSNKKTEQETIHCFEGEEIFDIYTLMQDFEIEEMFTKIKRQVRERIKGIEKSIQILLQEKMITGLNFDLLESDINDHDMTLWG